MQQTMHRVMINMNREKRALFNSIKRLGIAEDGIIYGGMVRDEIVATYYKSVFDEFISSMNPKPYDKFWDTSFHPESINRTLIPEDIDIYFKTNELATSFIEKITNFTKLYDGHISIQNVPRTHGLAYGHNLTHKKVRLFFRTGRTFSFMGHKLDIKIDMIINTTEQIIEPPFNRADFTSNLFVMVKSFVGNYDIRLSNTTGTKLDVMSFVAKNRIESQIIDDIVNGRTEFIRNVESYNSEYINGIRILKMISKPNHPYKITNLLFREISTSENTQNCDICLDLIAAHSTSGPFIEIITNKHASNVMHKKCFISYLEKEVGQKYRRNDMEHSECRCTRRNSFNFKESFKHSSLYK
jgi:hypothetical protein